MYLPPPRMLRAVKSFHEGRGQRSEVRNGPWQGFTLAPTLFNIYFSDVVASRRGNYAEIGYFDTGGSWLETGVKS